jgi:hypothetical protein
MAHSKLYSPSASHTWLACTASARLNAEKIRLSNPDADRGTRLHDFCYKEFDNDWDLIDFDSLGDDAEDARTAILAAWELQGMIDDPADIQKEIEVKVLEAEDCFGTADLVMYNSVEKHLLVADYKFGYNEVSAENNPQLLIYALGARRLYAQTGINSITLAIIQPKVNKKPALFTLSNADLNAWRDGVFFPAYRTIRDGKGVFCPGEKQCRWCPSRSDCPKLQGEITDMLNADAPEKELSWPERIRLAKLARLWADSQEESLLANLQAGVPCSGFKLVRGRSNRKWADEDEAAKWLAARGLKEKERYNFTVIGIPAAEKIVGGMNLTTKLQNSFNRLIVKPEGKLTYAPETDKREAVHVGDPLADEQAALDEL